MGTPDPFKNKNNPNETEAKQYRLWDNLDAGEKPPAKLMAKYDAHYYWQEFADLNNKAQIQQLCKQDNNPLTFLNWMCKLYKYESKPNDPTITEINQNQKFQLNDFIHKAKMLYYA